MAYINWADNDGTVPPRNSTEYAKALKAKGVPVHTKNFPTGGHGYGFSTSYTYHDKFIEDLTKWMMNVDATLTSIEAPVVTDAKDEVYYDLSGRRVDNPKRGIFITKGRKIFVK
jgi:acetyl esterase/lipase